MKTRKHGWKQKKTVMIQKNKKNKRNTKNSEIHIWEHSEQGAWWKLGNIDENQNAVMNQKKPRNLKLTYDNIHRPGLDENQETLMKTKKQWWTKKTKKNQEIWNSYMRTFRGRGLDEN